MTKLRDWLTGLSRSVALKFRRRSGQVGAGFVGNRWNVRRERVADEAVADVVEKLISGALDDGVGRQKSTSAPRRLALSFPRVQV
jgi:hypothetical protein